MTRQPKPGDYGLSTIGGHTGFWINIGMAIIGDSSRYTHAFLVLDDGTVIEAMPHGAIISPLTKYATGAVFSSMDLTDLQRTHIVRHARTCLGVRYGFSDYLALALAHIGITPKRLKNYIANNGRMICSQLVDDVYARAGVHLFDDGRLPQDVTPGDLLYVLLNGPVES